MVEFSFSLCYNGPNQLNTQDSYIGNTTASQAVKAGSTPVSCSMKKPLLSTTKEAFSMKRACGA